MGVVWVARGALSVSADSVGAWADADGIVAGAAAALRMPLGESDAPTVWVPPRIPLDESGAMATGIGRVPLGESGATAPAAGVSAGRVVGATPARAAGGVLAGPCWAPLAPAPAGAPLTPVATGRGGALAVGGGAAGGAGRAGGTVGMEVGFGIGVGRDAESGVRVGAAASVDAAGRFAAVEDTDVGFTAAMGRAALGAVA